MKRFIEKPDIPTAETLYLKKCLWNTLVLVGRAEMLLELFQTLVPEVFGSFQRIRAALGSAREEEAVRDVYTRLLTMNFSRAVLERCPERLGVLQMKGVYWSDWGEAERIQLDRARFRLRSRGPVVSEGFLDSSRNSADGEAIGHVEAHDAWTIGPSEVIQKGGESRAHSASMGYSAGDTL